MLRLALLIALVALPACTRSSKEAGELALKYEDLQRQFDDVSSRLAELDRRFDDTAFFRPSSQGSQVIWVGNGFLYVQVKDLKQDGDGYQVTFEIGNPMNAIFRDVAAVVSWGMPTELRSPAAEGGSRTVEARIKSELKPGTLTPVTVRMAPASGDDIASFQLRLASSGAAMLRR